MCLNEKEMIKYAKANLQIDPNRIYVTGLSLGGGGVWRVITDSENFDYSLIGGPCGEVIYRSLYTYAENCKATFPNGYIVTAFGVD